MSSWQDAPVYPRPRGGTSSSRSFALRSFGLSPPTRGNLRSKSGRGGELRSIPAHAGEPPRDTDAPAASVVYPRPRGGTRLPASAFDDAAGLSPPTRGNRRPRRRDGALRRSIPAHAGEPGMPHIPVLSERVYPRPRGGTSWKGDFGERPLSRREIPLAVFYQKHPVRVHDFARRFA